ncbi:MAG TPA: hypothetical protein VHE35_07145 [Kofleriaceae bacterium]|nr:hypothetical protein [Kofleriaceae bacterium]
MARDRSRPFSRKDRRYWLPITGGMILIMTVNVVLGFWLYDTSPRKLPKVVQPPPTIIDAGIDAGIDGPDGGAAVPADAGVEPTDAGAAPLAPLAPLR